MAKEKNVTKDFEKEEVFGSPKTDREAIKDSYEKYYKDSQKAGKTAQVSHDFYQWEEEGQVLIGKLIEFEAIDSKEYEGKYNRYIFDTDEGLMGVICGTVVDKLMAEQDLTGKVLRIEYQGQRQLDAGRTVNRFRIDIIK